MTLNNQFLSFNPTEYHLQLQFQVSSGFIMVALLPRLHLHSNKWNSFTIEYSGNGEMLCCHAIRKTMCSTFIGKYCFWHLGLRKLLFLNDIIRINILKWITQSIFFAYFVKRFFWFCSKFVRTDDKSATCNSMDHWTSIANKNCKRLGMRSKMESYFQ